MLDGFVTISVDEDSILPTDLQKNVNPLTITLKSVKNLPDTPITQQQLEQTSEPVYCKYDFIGQSTHVTRGRPHGRQVYFEDTHTIFVGLLNQGELREYIINNSFQVEVHDRDQHDNFVEGKSTPTNDHTDKHTNSALTTGIEPTQDVLRSEKKKPFDCFGIAKASLLDFLRGRTSICTEVPVTSCPIPEVPKKLESEDSKEARLFLVPGTVERPRRTAQLPGHYVEASTALKLKIKLRYPLVSPPNVPRMLSTPQQMCLYSRMIFYFSFKDKEYLRRVDDVIRQANARALGLEKFENDVIDAALSTFKLRSEQKASVTLDIITGFHLMDGSIHMVVIEGLRGGSIETFVTDLKRTDTKEDEILVHLYDSSLTFSKRLYTELDIDLCRVRLHQTMSKIMKQSLIYVKEMIPRKCFDCLIKCHQITQLKKLRDVAHSNLFPTHEMVLALAKEFGIPLTYEDFTEQHKARPSVGSNATTGRGQRGVGKESLPTNLPVSVASANKSSTTLVHSNTDFEEILRQRETRPSKRDHVTLNIVAVQEAGKRHRPSIPSIRLLKANAPAHNYSTQALNTSEQAKQLLREMFRDCDPKGRYTYNPDYHSAMFSPRCVESVRRKEKAKSQRQWKTPLGFVYPGMRSSLASNEHPSKPHESRIDDLKLKFRDNVLHRNTMAPTLSRSRLKWDDRAKEFDIHRKPQLDFGYTPSITIQSAGDCKVMEEKQHQSNETAKWRKKLVVDDALMRFHRLLWATEQSSDSNQLDRLPGLLKDPPKKLTFSKRPVFNMPALSVVTNPSVDTAARVKGVKLPPAFDEASELNVGFVPGPLEGHSWMMSNNCIPIKDEKHLKLNKPDPIVKPKGKVPEDATKPAHAFRQSHRNKLPPFQIIA